MSKLTFYDIPSKGRRACWSPNTWRTRMVLNFKGLEYETQWVEYPDIEKTLSPHVPPSICKEPADTPFALPAVKFSNGFWLMDSGKIAERLEKDHPQPLMRLDDPILPEVEKALTKCKIQLVGVWLPLVPGNLLNSPSKEYFHRTREVRFGKTLPQLMQQQGGEEAWMEALPGIKELGLILTRMDGPFVLGKNASYADFVIVGFLRFVKAIEEGIYQKVVKIEPALETLYDACKQWLERDSH